MVIVILMKENVQKVLPTVCFVGQKIYQLKDEFHPMRLISNKQFDKYVYLQKNGL